MSKWFIFVNIRKLIQTHYRQKLIYKLRDVVQNKKLRPLNSKKGYIWFKCVDRWKKTYLICPYISKGLAAGLVFFTPISCRRHGLFLTVRLGAVMVTRSSSFSQIIFQYTRCIIVFAHTIQTSVSRPKTRELDREWEFNNTNKITTKFTDRLTFPMRTRFVLVYWFDGLTNPLVFFFFTRNQCYNFSSTYYSKHSSQ